MKSPFRDRKIPNWAQDIIREVADSHGTHFHVILMDFRTDKACKARREAMYRIKKLKGNKLSSPVIGRWFGKNPASVLYSLARHAEQSGDPPLSKYSLRKWKSNGRRVGRPRKA